MSREAHVRFWEGVGVKLPRATHLLVLSERHLRRINFAYYHQARTHLALDKDAPDLRPIERPAKGKIVQLPEVGGLHHRYIRQAAYSSASSVFWTAERA